MPARAPRPVGDPIPACAGIGSPIAARATPGAPLPIVGARLFRGEAAAGQPGAGALRQGDVLFPARIHLRLSGAGMRSPRAVDLDAPHHAIALFLSALLGAN